MTQRESKRQVRHRQVYKHAAFGAGVVNTTLCGRERDARNVADTDSAVTCVLCCRVMNNAEKFARALRIDASARMAMTGSGGESLCAEDAYNNLQHVIGSIAGGLDGDFDEVKVMLREGQGS